MTNTDPGIHKATIPVLVLEDDPEHERRIRDFLLGESYEILSFNGPGDDSEVIYKILAERPDIQIAVVDLNLKAKRDFSFKEGIEFVENKLWPINRSMFYIVFSEYVKEPYQIPIGKVEPHWCFIRKEFEANGQLSDACLLEVVRALGVCSKLIDPLLQTPSYDLYQWTRSIDDYPHIESVAKPAFVEVVRNNAKRSVGILNDLSYAASIYSKSGETSRYLSIGVFGSCGRLEMRNDSDVEFCVFYDSSYSEFSERRLPLTFWNRMKERLQQQGIPFEGQDLIRGNSFQMLTLGQAEVEYQNRYLPIIDIQKVVDKDFKHHPQLRNRHLQILSEVRPVFNPGFLFELKRAILKKCIADTKQKETIITSPYLNALCIQFFLDAAPNDLDKWADVKKLLYRIFALLALRLSLIRELFFESKVSLECDEDWIEFLERLCDPPINKCLLLAESLRNHPELKGTNKKIHQSLDHIVSLSFRFAHAMSHREQRSEKADIDSLRPHAKALIDEYISFVSQLMTLKFVVNNMPASCWIFDREQLKGLRDII